ncbi:hypothetical protein ACFW84_31500 [Streptomyces anulatus]|uniref:hypothetical protein n=1 Tax=Streptomyces anulatus TaxID=1892 RepID=UPI00368FAC03
MPPKAIYSFELEQLGLITRPVYWTQGRGDAFAAALAALTIRASSSVLIRALIPARLPGTSTSNWP